MRYAHAEGQLNAVELLRARRWSGGHEREERGDKAAWWWRFDDSEAHWWEMGLPIRHRRVSFEVRLAMRNRWGCCASRVLLPACPHRKEARMADAQFFGEESHLFLNALFWSNRSSILPPFGSLVDFALPFPLFSPQVSTASYDSGNPVAAAGILLGHLCGNHHRVGG